MLSAATRADAGRIVSERSRAAGTAPVAVLRVRPARVRPLAGISLARAGRSGAVGTASASVRRGRAGVVALVVLLVFVALGGQGAGVWAAGARAAGTGAASAGAVSAGAASAGAAGEPEAGSEASDAQAAMGAPVVELSLAEAVQRALERAPGLTLARLDVTEAEIALKEAELGELVGRPRSEYDRAVQELRQARDGYMDALVHVALQVEEAYYGVLRAAELLQIQESNQEQSDRQFALTKARYEAGLIAQQDFLEAESSHRESLYRLEQARRSYAEAVRELAGLAGLPDDVELRLTEEFAFEPWAVPLEEALAEALAGRAELVRARRAVEQARRQLEQARAPYAAPVERVQAEIQLERAQVQYEQAAADVAAQVRREWFALKDAEHQVATARRREELARSRAKINRSRYDAGLLALMELLQSEASYAQARLDAAGAVWDYNLAKARFLRTLGRPELPPLPPSVAEYIAGWDELP